MVKDNKHWQYEKDDAQEKVILLFFFLNVSSTFKNSSLRKRFRNIFFYIQVVIDVKNERSPFGANP